ncbi:MAG: asparagine synthase C-terminal domain-containing protein [Syntrophaceae bacterium]|nr:asparagine synthase C-terminal domain-containing protein [Syntrophaceae bacterium]
MTKEFEALCHLLSEAVRLKSYDGLLFSGGLDTSLIAALNPKVPAVTVSLEGKATDIYYADLVAKKFGFKHVHYAVDVDEALGAISEVIGILQSFDPAIPNDLAAYFGLKKAKELGVTAIATGDASDELFGGYSFMQEIDDLEGYIRRISKTMTYSSNDICNFFGLKIVQPFTDKNVVDFALGLPRQMKIREENGQIWGKWILRKAFEDILPQEVLWQSKRPLEFGSGMTRLREVITRKISDNEFKEKQLAYPVKFLNKEHLYYYEIFRKVVGTIPVPKDTEKPCPGCGTGLEIDTFHCKICGYVLMSCTEGGEEEWRKKGAKQRKT